MLPSIFYNKPRLTPCVPSNNLDSDGSSSSDEEPENFSTKLPSKKKKKVGCLIPLKEDSTCESDSSLSDDCQCGGLWRKKHVETSDIIVPESDQSSGGSSQAASHASELSPVEFKAKSSNNIKRKSSRISKRRITQVFTSDRYGATPTNSSKPSITKKTQPFKAINGNVNKPVSRSARRKLDVSNRIEVPSKRKKPDIPFRASKLLSAVASSTTNGGEKVMSATEVLAQAQKVLRIKNNGRQVTVKETVESGNEVLGNPVTDKENIDSSVSSSLQNVEQDISSSPSTASYLPQDSGIVSTSVFILKAAKGSNMDKVLATNSQSVFLPHDSSSNSIMQPSRRNTTQTAAQQSGKEIKASTSQPTDKVQNSQPAVSCMINNDSSSRIKPIPALTSKDSGKQSSKEDSTAHLESGTLLMNIPGAETCKEKHDGTNTGQITSTPNTSVVEDEEQEWVSPIEKSKKTHSDDKCGKPFPSGNQGTKPNFANEKQSGKTKPQKKGISGNVVGTTYVVSPVLPHDNASKTSQSIPVANGGASTSALPPARRNRYDLFSEFVSPIQKSKKTHSDDKCGKPFTSGNQGTKPNFANEKQSGRTKPQKKGISGNVEETTYVESPVLPHDNAPKTSQSIPVANGGASTSTSAPARRNRSGKAPQHSGKEIGGGLFNAPDEQPREEIKDDFLDMAEPLQDNSYSESSDDSIPGQGWREGDLQQIIFLNEPKFSTPAEEITPTDYFKQYFDDKILDCIVEETNIYTTQKTGKSLDVSKEEILAFFGILIFMGVSRLPALTDYWASSTRIPQVADVMSRKRFQDIHANIHFHNNEEEGEDRLLKIRPLLNHIRKKCQNVEQECHLRATAVVSLCKCIRDPVNSTVTFDNYYTGIPLIQYLRDKMQLHSLGTIKRNRLLQCPLTDGKNLQARGRGSYESQVNKNAVVVVQWADNKAVCLASSYVGVEPAATIKRYCKDQKAKADVPCPQAVLQYNKSMGGVDLGDMLMALYAIPTKARRWYFPLMGYCLEVAITNSWLAYKRDCVLLGTHQELKSSKDFRLHVSDGLRASLLRGRGRPSLDNSLQKKVIKSPWVPRPSDPLRTDEANHWPVKCTKGRCRYCSNTVRIKCTKCDTRLCITQDRNCFLQFHITKSGKLPVNKTFDSLEEEMEEEVDDCEEQEEIEDCEGNYDCDADVTKIGSVLNETMVLGGVAVQQGPISDMVDLDETLYEPAELEKIVADEQEKVVGAKEEKHIETEVLQKQNKQTKRRQHLPSPIKHVCKLPRCPEHQPFYESSNRKLKQYSPRTRRMGTTKRSKSPKNLWSLDMPSSKSLT
ncbi:Chimeric ERCC6-PGBD3 protein [Frankliniella fusca]|uniref:Chimeric ERCC6-PGBD3 protein n=1 Tax=Frankliniella fusca TaxID=407009 RepID=A0AAE1L688_9NEOP|nr:Chimeric ERCC6-PGBD3 protein [Frankliniella fusca]